MWNSLGCSLARSLWVSKGTHTQTEKLGVSENKEFHPTTSWLRSVTNAISSSAEIELSR